MAELKSEVIVIREDMAPEDSHGLTLRTRRAAQELKMLEDDLGKILGTNEAESAALLGVLWESSLIPDLMASCQAMRNLLWAYFLQLMRQRTGSTDAAERSQLSARAKAVLDQIETLSRMLPPAQSQPREAA